MDIIELKRIDEYNVESILQAVCFLSLKQIPVKMPNLVREHNHHLYYRTIPSISWFYLMDAGRVSTALCISTTSASVIERAGSIVEGGMGDGTGVKPGARIFLVCAGRTLRIQRPG